MKTSFARIVIVLVLVCIVVVGWGILGKKSKLATLQGQRTRLVGESIADLKECQRYYRIMDGIIARYDAGSPLADYILRIGKAIVVFKETGNPLAPEVYVIVDALTTQYNNHKNIQQMDNELAPWISKLSKTASAVKRRRTEIKALDQQITRAKESRLIFSKK
jgi:hypothetical protein